MTQSRLLLCMIAVLLLAGVGAWFVLKGPAAGTRGSDMPTVATADADQDTPLDAGSKGTDPSAEATTTPPPLTLSPEQLEAERAEAERKAAAPGRTPTNGPREGAQGPGATPTQGPEAAKPAQPAQPRRPTRAEQEEQRRQETGRPALARTLGRTPGGTGSVSSGLTKSPEQAKWEEQWYKEGFTPPEMTPTPVSGKIMSQEAREGLAGATVGLISYFPVDGIAGGPLLPVITELKTDENGLFSGEIPASKLSPLNYPSLAICVTWEGHRIVAASPVASLEVGKPNEFGIFWAPQTPFTLSADATRFPGELRVVATGECDPQRWHASKRADTLAYFPAFNVATEGPAEGKTGPAIGFADVIGTWDGNIAPYVSLLQGAQILQTKRPERAAVISSKSGDSLPAPFEVLVFDNDAYSPIGGQVVNGEGLALTGAAVTTIGGSLAQTVVTDGAGWFFFKDPPEGVTALHCVHGDYVATRVHGVAPGDNHIRIEMKTPRPRVQLYIVDRISRSPLLDISIRVTGLHAWGKDVGKPLPVQITTLTSEDGNFLLEWEFALHSITLEKLGYFPRTIADPSAVQEASDGRIDVELSPGRNLEVRPRDFTAAATPERWYPDSGEGPGIYSPWSHHWIEWEIDFGDAPDEGEEGGKFDMVLGCTNRGIVDNDYQFVVDVFVDGVKKGTLNILADSLNERTGRLALGALSGTHTIRVEWKNDKWIPEQLDANIRLASLKFPEQP